MCGIFGLVVEKNKFKGKQINELVKTLLLLSQTRGKDSSGIAATDNEKIIVFKKDKKPSHLIKLDDYKHVFKAFYQNCSLITNNIGIIGHARMVTNGTFQNSNNNQPIIKSGIVLVHNGIIVNDVELWSRFPTLKREFEVDTEIIAALMNYFLLEGENYSNALVKVFQLIKGAASIGIMTNYSNKIFLCSNNGSLYVGSNMKMGLIAFASEKNMLCKAFVKKRFMNENEIIHINRNVFATIDIKGFFIEYWSPSQPLNDGFIEISERKTIYNGKDDTILKPSIPNIANQEILQFSKLLEDNEQKISELRRCTRCLIPETFPGIIFDEFGVCSLCNSWKSIEYQGIDVLNKFFEINRYRSSKPYNLLLPLSGGRDSCFALHYLKKEMGMSPVTYTYDWGMVTDLARRNISRITSALGVEHILISADIKKKREYIKKNVIAWLKKPSLGTIPLFMAGDKQYFYYANLIKKQFNIDLLIFGMNPLERTDFKVAFAGIKENEKENRHYHLSLINKMKIFSYYGKEFLLNPSFLNSSLIDSFWAFLSYYFIPHNYLIFYEYYPWNEKTINDTIINQYEWEISPDTPTTWRIGDGTASFYNYIYLTMAGFTENDTFRSNQIRQGLISRDEALRLVINENRPRYQSIRWYFDTIGIDFERTLTTINNVPKLY